MCSITTGQALSLGVLALVAGALSLAGWLVSR